MDAIKRGFWSAFLHHLSASKASAHPSVTLKFGGAGGRRLDFIERPHVTAARFLGNSERVYGNFFFFPFHSIEAAAALISDWGLINLNWEITSPRIPKASQNLASGSLRE